MTSKYRVHHWTEYDYSEIKEYVDEWHTDKPLRNDEVVDLLNSQDKRIKELETELEKLLKSIQVFSLMEGLNDSK